MNKLMKSTFIRCKRYSEKKILGADNNTLLSSINYNLI